MWQGINSLRTGKSKINHSVNSVQVDNNIISNPLTIANSFNSYFCNVADNVRYRIPKAHKQASSFLTSKSNPDSLFFFPTNAKEVLNIITSLNLNKSSGPFSIPAKILSLLKIELSKPISELINLSFISGTFPSKLKTAKVIRIFKTGSPLTLSNYRPISLLSNVEKIFEKVIYKRLISFFDKHNILYHQQFGFRKGHSTSHAVLTITQIF